jgi:UTP--glucose-1-phosphate uridylyltransferase
VKTTNDLLVLRSDVYEVVDDMLVEPIPGRDGKLPFVDLDKRFYGILDEFDRRFPAGAPSLVAADRLIVRGDVTFGAGVSVRGAVELETDEPLRIEDGSVLGG